ncbi:MAG: hypothetical protein MNSN_05930 [Minisyncoccus archaeiphilus]|jgi:hypothetical protein|uniref:hypothetical protein n=1 Tax=Minisyncoccus archaeiphilus TaxID=3238481 RepID=UPI0009D5F232|nr:MAG: hypothetical protein BWY21_01844 [Parcubacteria group bacterium ADurb.Bin216]GMX59591.1 MAG: hypothetical protein MNSN_05930 [Candidatus Parcubacteria bacterium]
MEEETYKKEVAMCKELSQNNNGKCNWGECDKCGVIPLLHKLRTGEALEKDEEIERLKKEVLSPKRSQ